MAIGTKGQPLPVAKRRQGQVELAIGEIADVEGAALGNGDERTIGTEFGEAEERKFHLAEHFARLTVPPMHPSVTLPCHHGLAIRGPAQEIAHATNVLFFCRDVPDYDIVHPQIRSEAFVVGRPRQAYASGVDVERMDLLS